MSEVRENERRIFIGNLDYDSVTEEDIRHYFLKYGTILNLDFK